MPKILISTMIELEEAQLDPLGSTIAMEAVKSIVTGEYSVEFQDEFVPVNR